MVLNYFQESKSVQVPFPVCIFENDCTKKIKKLCSQQPKLRMPHESPKQTPFACFLLGSIILAVCSVHGQSVHCLMCLLLLIIIIRYKSPQIFSLLFFWFTEITTESIFISVFKRFLLSTLPKI